MRDVMFSSLSKEEQNFFFEEEYFLAVEKCLEHGRKALWFINDEERKILIEFICLHVFKLQTCKCKQGCFDAEIVEASLQKDYRLYSALEPLRHGVLYKLNSEALDKEKEEPVTLRCPIVSYEDR